MRIIIVGGGTAGWLAALIISKLQSKKHSITVVESSKIGIIGAGEGSTGLMTNVIQNIVHNYGCNEQEFVESADVTPKYGIEFKNWRGDEKSYISPIDGTATSSSPLDYLFLHSISKLPQNKWHTATELGILAELNKYTFSHDRGPAAYHFDAHKVGKYFKKVCGEVVKNIDAEVVNVQLDNDGFINTLNLSNGNNIEGDFFIDASGFSRVLMNKMNVKWHSYKNNLPVDRAMPFLMPYKENEVIKPLTTAWAQNSGWMWQIPTLNRKGCGYVYSSEFLSDDQAQQDLEFTIGESVEPIKIIKFDSGRLEKLWHKNCLAIGLSAAFAEPLEATSIHTTIQQIEDFVTIFLKDTQQETCNIDGENLYNEKTVFMYDLLKDFLVLHYMGGRTDTEFWRYISSGATLTPFTRDMIEMCKHRIPNNSMFPGVSGIAGWPLWCYIMAGVGAITPENAEKELKHHRLDKYAEMEYNKTYGVSNSQFQNFQDNTQAIRQRQR